MYDGYWPVTEKTWTCCSAAAFLMSSFSPAETQLVWKMFNVPAFPVTIQTAFVVFLVASPRKTVIMQTAFVVGGCASRRTTGSVRDFGSVVSRTVSELRVVFETFYVPDMKVAIRLAECA